MPSWSRGGAIRPSATGPGDRVRRSARWFGPVALVLSHWDSEEHGGASLEDACPAGPGHDGLPVAAGGARSHDGRHRRRAGRLCGDCRPGQVCHGSGVDHDVAAAQHQGGHPSRATPARHRVRAGARGLRRGVDVGVGRGLPRGARARRGRVRPPALRRFRRRRRLHGRGPCLGDGLRGLGQRPGLGRREPGRGRAERVAVVAGRGGHPGGDRRGRAADCALRRPRARTACPRGDAGTPARCVGAALDRGRGRGLRRVDLAAHLRRRLLRPAGRGARVDHGLVPRGRRRGVPGLVDEVGCPCQEGAAAAARRGGSARPCPPLSPSACSVWRPASARPRRRGSASSSFPAIRR
jgi:hypothetical protein